MAILYGCIFVGKVEFFFLWLAVLVSELVARLRALIFYAANFLMLIQVFRHKCLRKGWGYEVYSSTS